MYNPEDESDYYHIFEAAIRDALATLPKDTNADKIAEWLLANRWQSFPDEMKNYMGQRSLGTEFCNWAKRQANYYATLSHLDALDADDRPF